MSIKNNTFIYIIMVVIATMFAVKIMPYSNDYEAYTDLFKYTFNDPSFDRMEIGFRSTVTFFKSLNDSLSFYWFCFAIISLALKFHVLKSFDSDCKILFVLYVLYCISLLALHEGTQIRAAMAIALGFCGFHSRNIVISLLFFITAIAFHYSSAIFVPLYFLGNIIRTYKIFWLAIVTGIATVFPILLERFSGLLISVNPLFNLYLENSDMTEVNKYSVTLIVAFIFFLVNFFVGKKLSRYRNEINNTFQKYNLFSFLFISSLILLSALSFSPVLSIRLYELLSLSPFAVIACLYSRQVNNMILLYRDTRLAILRILLLLTIMIMSLHRFIAYYFVNPIINF
ncbi:EpsG family protein [Enterobacter bugandensis]|uniref:EpsG family protein n=1 Tax=Enterobacter bugandensis TaxID=881260 RepID=UPI0020053732|nr:EpsG family protein [Enterobacter bugandensis]MCK7134051.1 EpsG family protein [Enterobacter bugandensis]